MSYVNDIGLEFSYESASRPDFDFSDIDNFQCHNSNIISLKRLVMKNGENELKVFSGPVYLFHFDYFFFHQIQEAVGYFEFIKSRVPNIKAVFVDRNGISQSSNPEDFFSKLSSVAFHDRESLVCAHAYFEDLYKIYKEYSYDNLIHPLSFKEIPINFLFEDVYLLVNNEKRTRFIPENFLSDLELHVGPSYLCEGHSADTNCVSKKIQEISLMLHKQTILKNLNKDDSLPKKVYISRKDANARYTKDIDFIDKWVFGWPEESRQAWVKGRSTRIYNQEDYIVDYFKSKGYEIYSFEGMQYLEQLQILHNATHVAGIIGSGMLNTFICDEGTNVYEIHVTNDYTFSYEYVSRAFNLNYNFIDIRNTEKSFEAISQEIEKFSV